MPALSTTPAPEPSEQEMDRKNQLLVKAVERMTERAQSKQSEVWSRVTIDSYTAGNKSKEEGEETEDILVIKEPEREPQKKSRKTKRQSPFQIICTHHPLLSKFSPYFNYELLLRKIRILEPGEELYSKGESKELMWMILYGELDITLGGVHQSSAVKGDSLQNSVMLPDIDEKTNSSQTPQKSVSGSDNQ